jgi:hypothetical protein
MSFYDTTFVLVLTKEVPLKIFGISFQNVCI